MTVRSAQSITVVFTTRRFDTSVATNADSTPTGTLYVNGTADAASVTVTNITTGVYKAAVTLPTLAVGDRVDLRIAATVNSVSDNGIIWQDVKDVVVDSAGLADANTVKVGPTGSGTAQTARDLGGIFTGITSLAQWLGLIAGKHTGNTTARTELRATGAGGGAYDETTDSQEAIRDRGDAAWITATGFSTHTAADVWSVGTRTLTSFGSLASDVATAVWAAGTRTLSSFGSLVSDIVTAVWGAGTRTLSAFGFTVDTNANATEFAAATSAAAAAASAATAATQATNAATQATNAATSAASVDSKLTTERADNLDDVAQETAATANKAEVLAAIEDIDPGSGGSGTTIIEVTPLISTVPTQRIVPSAATQAFRYCPLPSGPIAIFDENLDPIDLSDYQVKMIAVDEDHPEITFTLVEGAPDNQLTVGGADNNQITVDYVHTLAGNYAWTIYRKLNSGGNWSVIAIGGWQIEDCPSPDA